MRARTSRKRNRRQPPVVVADPALLHLIHQLVVTLTSLLSTASTCRLSRCRGPLPLLTDDGRELAIGRRVEHLSVGRQRLVIPALNAVDGDELRERRDARCLCEPLFHAPRVVDVVMDDSDMNPDQIPHALLILTDHSATRAVGRCDVVGHVDQALEADLAYDPLRDDRRLRLPIDQGR